MMILIYIYEWIVIPYPSFVLYVWEILNMTKLVTKISYENAEDQNSYLSYSRFSLDEIPPKFTDEIV